MRVLNLGSLNLDKTYSVKHFVQPKETIQALRYEEFCGGKGLNQSVAIARAGAKVYHAGKIGTDGERLLTFLKQAGVQTDYIQSTDRATGHAVIQVDETGQNNIIIWGGANADISRGDIDRATEVFWPGDLLLLQNEISNVDYAIRRARQQNMKVVFNPSPINDAIVTYPLELVDCFILNEVEGRCLARVDSEEPDVILEGLKARFPGAEFVLTVGEKGAYFFDGEQTLYQKTYSVDVVDTTGAGDTFCGYFLASMAQERPVREALRMASAAAALSVTRQGAAQSIPDKKEVEAFLASQEKGGD